MKKTLATSIPLTLLISGALLSQAPSTQEKPAVRDHPAVGAADRRETISRLTESVAGVDTGRPAAPVPRQNLIDDHIFDRMKRDGIRHAPLADDGAFYRRIHLDLTGRIPDAEAAQQFIASGDRQKRDQLIDALVAGDEFREKWTYWFCDLARAGQSRVGMDGRNLFYKYIHDALQYNQPFDELISELITAKARSNWYVGPASYLVRWVVFGDACSVTMHEDTADDMTVNLFKHFMGLNLQCISCHDGANHLEKMNLWLTSKTRLDFWRQSAFFGNTRVLRRIEISAVRDEYLIDDKGGGYSAAASSTVRIKRNGEGSVEPAFILTGEKPQPGKPLRQELARMFTSHPQFARATVNTFWTELMGVGIVDPPWEFDLLRFDPNKPPPEGWSVQATHPELLEALAEDFRKHDYDLQHLFKLITKSSTCQLSSSFPGEWKDSYSSYYARKFARRLTAEQMHDAIVKATELYTEFPIPGTDTKMKYVTQTRGPYDATDSKYLDKQFGEELEFFLDSFGQSNRESNEPTTDGAIVQAILLMNSPFVKSKVQAEPGSHLGKLLRQEPALSDEELTGRLFWRFLSRAPDESEKSEALALLAGGRREGAEDLQWILMNKVDFLFNY